jgi:hypothetical protein
MKMREVRITAVVALVCLAQIGSVALAARLGAADVLLLAVDAGLLFLAGLAYAFYIAATPFRPRFTWLSVADGCALTNTALSIALYVLTRDLMIASLPWWAYALSGLSMIAFQVYKYRVQIDLMHAEAEDEHAL